MKATKYDHRLGVYTKMKLALATVTAFNDMCRENGYVGSDENQMERFILTNNLLEAEAKLAEFDNQHSYPRYIIKQRLRAAEDNLEAINLVMAAGKACFTGTEINHYQRQIADAKERLDEP